MNLPSPSTDISFISLVLLLLVFLIFLSQSLEMDRQKSKAVLKSLEGHFYSGGRPEHHPDNRSDNRSGGSAAEAGLSPEASFIPETAAHLTTTPAAEQRGPLAALAEAHGITFEANDASFSFIFPSERLFAAGQEQLSVEFLPLLQKLIQEAKSSGLHTAVVIRGVSNAQLPARHSLGVQFDAYRAASLYRYLVDGGIDAARVSASAAAEVPGESAAGRTVITLLAGGAPGSAETAAKGIGEL